MQMLNEQQVTFFETFGFIILRKVLSEEELAKMNDEFDASLKNIQGERPDNEPPKHFNWSNLGPETPFLSLLPEDTRICETAEQLFGENVVAVSSNSNRRVGDTRWHTDQSHPHFCGWKFAAYLQPLNSDNGAFRVIPGSHKQPFNDTLKHIEMDSPEITVPYYSCDSAPGDIIIFNFATWHSSWGGSFDRRMCTVDFYKNPETPEEVEGTYDQVIVDEKVYANIRASGSGFHPHWLANANNSPRRQRWIDWLRKYGFVKSEAA